MEQNSSVSALGTTLRARAARRMLAHAMSGSSYTLARAMALLGVPYRTTSIGPRAPLNIGGRGRSHHVVGNALDVAGPRRSQVPTPEMDAIFDAWAPYAEHLTELIYAGRMRNVKHGRWVPRYAVSIHRNHVHIAATQSQANTILRLLQTRSGTS
jgi:hypothetical protein